MTDIIIYIKRLYLRCNKQLNILFVNKDNNQQQQQFIYIKKQVDINCISFFHILRQSNNITYYLLIKR